MCALVNAFSGFFVLSWLHWTEQTLKLSIEYSSPSKNHQIETLMEQISVYREELVGKTKLVRHKTFFGIHGLPGMQLWKKIWQFFNRTHYKS